MAVFQTFNKGFASKERGQKNVPARFGLIRKRGVLCFSSKNAAFPKKLEEKLGEKIRMRKHFPKFFVFFAAAFAVLVFAATETAAQRSLTKAQVDRLIKNVEERVDRFTSQIDDSLDRSRLDGTEREDKINERARDLEAATDELRREFDRRDSWIENKAEVRKCMNIATDINATMRARKFGATTEANWRAVVSELNALAKAYRLPRIGGAYR